MEGGTDEGMEGGTDEGMEGGTEVGGAARIDRDICIGRELMRKDMAAIVPGLGASESNG